MALIKTGGGVTDIRGGFGGTYFTRDRSGLHQTAKPRRVRQRTTAQDTQRKAFTKARTYTKDPRTVSYYIYRALNNLPFIFEAFVTGETEPDCTGKYELAGTFNDKDYYTRNNDYFIIREPPDQFWAISQIIDLPDRGFWKNVSPNISGLYLPDHPFTGIATVTLQLLPPPIDYYIPKL